MMTKWRTKLTLNGEDTSPESDELSNLKGILQGDTLNLILFILSVNPLSYLLLMEEGIQLTIEDLVRIITHLFFVDDLKPYVKNKEKLRVLLDLVTRFTQDIGIKFGESKCAYGESKCAYNIII